jgi:hypothetical protein
LTKYTRKVLETYLMHTKEEHEEEKRREEEGGAADGSKAPALI